MQYDALALHIFGYKLITISKTTVYFCVVALVAVAVTQPGCTRRLDAQPRNSARGSTRRRLHCCLW